jgi:ABC-2 type transport system ATP-binding protein
MIELKNISKKYGDILAVNGLDLNISKGEIFGFIGPNGAGKTTTINIMGGILSPTSGSVKICNIRMEAHPEKTKGKIGFIPDRPHLYEKLTGMEYLKFTADLYGVEQDAFYDKANAQLEMFSLMDWSNDLIESYSHGMKQRLVMAAALLHDPEVIIVDEPMVGLDPAGIKMVKDLFRTLAGKGVTIFMSTHTLTVAEDVCDRIGIIHKGSLIATGTADELKQKVQEKDADLEQVFFRMTNDHLE